MFDLAWSEIMLIGAVALVVIGPKELPGAIRGVADMVKKARRMAGEFQGHVDEMVREAKLDDVRNQINEIRNFDIRSEVEKAVDKDGSLRASIDQAQAAFREPPPAGAPYVPPVDEAPVAAPQAVVAEPVEPAPAAPPPALAPPPFVPPGIAAPPVAAPAKPAPAFVPPGADRAA
jgi:sec-independent protein translocase protein TatB